MLSLKGQRSHDHETYTCYCCCCCYNLASNLVRVAFVGSIVRDSVLWSLGHIYPIRETDKNDNWHRNVCSLIKAQSKGLAIALLTRLEQQRFTVLEVAADWHGLMIPWRIMRPSITRDGKQLDPRCSTQTYHRPSWRDPHLQRDH